MKKKRRKTGERTRLRKYKKAFVTFLSLPLELERSSRGAKRRDVGRKRRKQKHSPCTLVLSLTLLEQALKLQPSKCVLRESGQLRQVDRVVGDSAVEEPVGPRQVFRGILCRSRGTELARGRRESALERGLHVENGIDCGAEAVGELVMVMVLCLLRGL